MDLQPIIDNITTTKEKVVEQKDNMVLGLLSAVAACPAIIGTTEAVRQGQKKNAKEKHRGQKSNMIVHCSAKSSKRSQIDGGLIVLRNNKVTFFLVPCSSLIFIHVTIFHAAHLFCLHIRSFTSMSLLKKVSNSKSPPPTLSQATS